MNLAELQLTTPNPGSGEALDMGCTCPVMDNRRGTRFMGYSGVYAINQTCPVHNPKETTDEPN